MSQTYSFVAVFVTPSAACGPKLITNSGLNSELTENVYNDHCETAEADLSKVLFLFILNLLCNLEFDNLHATGCWLISNCSVEDNPPKINK